MTGKQDPFDVKVLDELLADRAETATHGGNLPEATHALGSYVVMHQLPILDGIRATLPEAEKREPRVPVTSSIYKRLCTMLSKQNNDFENVGHWFALNEEYFMPGIRKTMDREKGRVPSKFSMER